MRRSSKRLARWAVTSSCRRTSAMARTMRGFGSETPFVPLDQRRWENSRYGSWGAPTRHTTDSRGPWGSETRTSCRDLVVLVNETAESVPAPNAGGDCYRIRPSPNLDTSGRPKREASVRPLIVVVPQVLVEHPLKMTPTPDQHPIQTLLPHRPHRALGERVGVRRLNRGLMIWTPSAAKTSSKARVNLASRSRRRNRGAVVPS